MLCFVSIFARLLSIRFVNASKENQKRWNARKCLISFSSFDSATLLRCEPEHICDFGRSCLLAFPHSFYWGFFFWLFCFRTHSVYFIFIAFGNVELQSNSLWTLQFLRSPPRRSVEYICFSLSLSLSNRRFVLRFLRSFILSALAR